MLTLHSPRKGHTDGSSIYSPFSWPVAAGCSTCVTALFTLLQVQFEYPDILRQPTADILTKFQAGGTGLIAAWYALTLTAVLFIPVVLLVHRVMAADRAPMVLWIATTFGVVAGLAQTLGFLRWPFLVPHLAQAYLDPAASEAQRAAAAMVFEAFHRYAGMAVGEHLGYLSTSTWTFLIALLMLRSPLFGRWLGLSGMALALGVASGLLEPAGVPLVGAINAISYLGWAAWLIVVGVVLLVRRPEIVAQSQQMVATR
ncbi:MAG: DUF4386 domain-containing protein [Roseiflexaceae bacterium]|nr:DUF4386 domain-containing protein [Roseiflexaceae bacterium]